MSAVKEIEAAIQNLSLREREELMACLPALFPELNGDAAWEQLIRDPRPLLDLSALLDQVEDEYQGNSTTFPETSDTELNRQS